jgi:hypothetical protein
MPLKTIGNSAFCILYIFEGGLVLLPRYSALIANIWNQLRYRKRYNVEMSILNRLNQSTAHDVFLMQKFK